jgi:hypothetical protein
VVLPSSAGCGERGAHIEASGGFRSRGLTLILLAAFPGNPRLHGASRPSSSACRGKASGPKTASAARPAWRAPPQISLQRPGSLTDNDEFESLGIQIADAFFIGTAASHAETLLMVNPKVEFQTPGIVMDEKDSAFGILPGSRCAV